jgi:hypothetical protein
MALVSLLPKGVIPHFLVFLPRLLSKRKETHLEREHLLLHSKVKLAELHHHTSYGPNLA